MAPIVQLAAVACHQTGLEMCQPAVAFDFLRSGPFLKELFVGDDEGGIARAVDYLGDDVRPHGREAPHRR